MLQRPGRRCEGTAMGSIATDRRLGLGKARFSLGMPIFQAFAQIEQHPNVLGGPLKVDVINFPHRGFYLRFDPSSQSLREIEIYDAKRLLAYYPTPWIGQVVGIIQSFWHRPGC